MLIEDKVQEALEYSIKLGKFNKIIEDSERKISAEELVSERETLNSESLLNNSNNETAVINAQDPESLIITNKFRSEEAFIKWFEKSLQEENDIKSEASMTSQLSEESSSAHNKILIYFGFGNLFF